MKRSVKQNLSRSWSWFKSGSRSWSKSGSGSKSWSKSWSWSEESVEN